MIPKLDRKWCRTGNDPHIGPQMIPTKNKEWHEFISEEGENIYKNYKLSFYKKYSSAAFLFFEGYWLRKTDTCTHPRNPGGDSINLGETGVNVIYPANCQNEVQATGDMALLGHEAELHNYSLELLVSQNT